MRNWKNWLFPILTVLTVAALALLPLRLSILRDGQLTGTVHAEELPEDSNFPFKPPDMPGRVWLLVQLEEMPDNLTIMSQELEGAERDREFQRLHEALADLEGVLPPELVEILMDIEGYSWEWNRFYLRDQTDLSSASFTVTGTYDKQQGISFAATLDGESGQIVKLQIAGIGGTRFDSSPAKTGAAILERLGLAYELADDLTAEETYGLATFRLLDCGCWFQISQFDYSLSLGFHVDWEAVESGAAEAHGYSTDASPMQIW